MKYVVSSREMKLYDRNTSEHFGVDTAILMERASLCVADEIRRYRETRGGSRKYRVLILAGVGNNAGDGVCVGRILKTWGFRVSICVVGDPTKCSDLLLKQLEIAGKYGIFTETLAQITKCGAEEEYDIIVDALFGIGLTRPVTGDFLKAIEFTADCKSRMGSDLLLISVDMPSGINADNGLICGAAVKADKTVTFNHIKLGHVLYPGCEYAGELVIADAGITDESFLGKEPLVVCHDGEATDLLPERRKDANKGTNGKVLIIAGSKDISGACILSASAALKAGAGMVRVFTAAENAEAVKALLPEAILDIYEDYEPVREKLIKAFDWSTQAVIGPGIGTEGKGKELLDITLREYDKSLVMDADALNIIASDEEMFRLAENFAVGKKELILTPHMGEFSRLVHRDIKSCRENLVDYPKELAKKLHATVVCKDARSIVADRNEKKIYININGNDGMATAGSGDVLSGIIGAFLCFEKSGFEIAAAGTFVHGRAGDIAAQRFGRYSMVATDIVKALSEVIR